MARKAAVTGRLKDIEEKSKHWSPEDLIQNLDEELSRMERGMGHMIYDMDCRRISAWLRPLPVTPTFDMKEDAKSMTLSVKLPNVPKENIRVDVEKNSIELFACTEDAVCRPRYISVESQGLLDPDSTEAKMVGDTLEIRVLKARKKKVRVD